MASSSPLGTYPTPVVRLFADERDARAAGLAAGVELWCKRDDLTSSVYGGNKVRKLEHLLSEARDRGARRLVTIGAVGSHHVLATTLYGRRAGFEVEAVLAPQPWSPHVEEVARVDASLGLMPFPVRSFASVPLAVARRLAPRRGGTPAYFIPPGGSSVTGTLGYVDGARELAQQIASGDVPRPHAIVVALGSGGTVAGLLVGLAREGLLSSTASAPAIEVIAVQVINPPLASGPATLALALGALRRTRAPITRAAIASLSRALRVVRRHLGRGYGHATAEGSAATLLAEQAGVSLDPTYTAKTFAAALDEARAPDGARRVILYWHTLAAPGPFARLLAVAPPIDAVDARVRGLMRRA